MADEPKELFKVDAGVLVAKLHLAAKQQVEVKDPIIFIKNAGVLNEKKGDTPDKATDATFDFKSGPTYEVGFFVEVKDLRLPYEQYSKEYKKLVTDNQKLDSNKIKKIEDSLDKENEELKKQLEKTIADLKKKVADLAKIYFTFFVGAKNAAKVNVASLADPILWTELKDSDFDKIECKSGKILPPNESALEKQQEEEKKQFEEDAKKKTQKLLDKPPTRYYCYKLAYTAEFGN